MHEKVLFDWFTENIFILCLFQRNIEWLFLPIHYICLPKISWTYLNMQYFNFTSPDGSTANVIYPAFGSILNISDLYNFLNIIYKIYSAKNSDLVEKGTYLINKMSLTHFIAVYFYIYMTDTEAVIKASHSNCENCNFVFHCRLN